MFKIRSLYVLLFVIIVLLVLWKLFWRTAGTVLIGTTGFSCGLYSMILMMLYQSQFGTQYTSVSLFMIFLSAGFTAGFFIKSHLFNDVTVLVYTLFSLLIFMLFHGFPESIWFMSNFLMGLIVAAQLVNVKDNVASLSAADIAGGVTGILLGGVYILPYFGIAGALVAVLVVKMLSVFYFESESEKSNYYK